MNYQDFEELKVHFETKVYPDLKTLYQEELKTANNKGINIIHINIRSLTINTFNTLQVYLENIMKKLDVIVLTEINCKKEQMFLFELNGYKMNYVCRENGKGGGILVYTKNYLNIEICNNLKFKNAENLEFEINEKIVFNAIYRPPKQNIKKFIDELKKWIQNKNVINKDVIIIGDLNINTLENNSNTREYVEILSNNGIMNTIKKITREELVNNSWTSSCIDHINVRSKNTYTAAVVKEKIADHYFVFTRIEQNITSKYENHLVEINIIDEEKINKLIEEYDWNVLMVKYKNDDNIENLYNDFINIFQNLYKNSEKKISIKKKYVGNTWITKEIRDLIKKKNEKWKELKKK